MKLALVMPVQLSSILNNSLAFIYEVSSKVDETWSWASTFFLLSFPFFPICLRDVDITILANVAPGGSSWQLSKSVLHPNHARVLYSFSLRFPSKQVLVVHALSRVATTAAVVIPWFSGTDSRKTPAKWCLPFFVWRAKPKTPLSRSTFRGFLILAFLVESIS